MLPFQQYTRTVEVFGKEYELNVHTTNLKTKPWAAFGHCGEKGEHYIEGQGTTPDKAVEHWIDQAKVKLDF